GDTAWNVNDVTFQGKYQALDLKHSDFSIGNINLKNIGIITTDQIFNIGFSNTETATFGNAAFIDAANVATVDLVAKTAIADNLMQARWVAANITAASPAAVTFVVYAKTDLNNVVSSRFKLYEPDGITEVAKTGLGEDQRYNIITGISENKMDGLPTPQSNGKRYYIKAITAGNKVLKDVGFKVTGEGSQYAYFSEIDDFTTALLANSSYFNFVSDIAIGVMIPFYVWFNALVGATVGVKNIEFTYMRYITGE
ncbi:MAG: hypothetical protein KJ648_06880, partial [Candidatus Omnitrophica bacterium]|nr:hypothetical protein [Candidatus Omnitrophota bacterium]